MLKYIYVDYEDIAMDGLTVAIRRCNLKLKLDNETEGQGNCFPNSIVQQCRRPEVREWLKQKKPSAIFNGQQWVRRKVTHLALSSDHGSIIDLKAKYEQEIQQVESRSWIEYWNHMAQDGIWVDHIAVYYKDSTFIPTVDIRHETMQLTKLESINLDIIIVYRSEKGNTTELLDHIISMIREEKATVISGDFNICYKTNRKNKISKFLETNGFKQFVEEPTHIRGRHIDHLYFKPSKLINESPAIYRYTPYYSDHDAICATFKPTNGSS